VRRVASCSCGALRVATAGEPYVVSMCHCTACQRRTGAPFGVGAYFKSDQVTIEGERRDWSRRGTSGGLLTNYFCPTCGTNVYWTTEYHADGVGVAVGAFADPSFPGPVRSVWEAHRYEWVEPPVENRFIGPSDGPRVSPSA
jgi:hypothetical protein